MSMLSLSVVAAIDPPADRTLSLRLTSSKTLCLVSSLAEMYGFSGAFKTL